MNERERSLRQDLDELNKQQSTGNKPPDLYPDKIENIDLILWHRIGENLRNRYTGRPWADLQARRGGEIIGKLIAEVERLQGET